HELVMVVVSKKIRMYLFVMQMLQLPLIALGRLPVIREKWWLGNAFFWFSLFVGLPMLGIFPLKFQVLEKSNEKPIFGFHDYPLELNFYKTIFASQLMGERESLYVYTTVLGGDGDLSIRMKGSVAYHQKPSYL
ncbi:16237_t:CDS:2, partial [Acaulospora morrowiae]